MNKPQLPSMGGFHRISTDEKINFTRHLAIIIKAGVPLLESLRILRKQPMSKTMGKVADQMLTDVNNGRFLSNTLERYPRFFSEFFVNIIRVGETSGTLADNLLYMADELKKSKALKSKVNAALVYPIVVLVATIAVAGFLTFFIFPKILPVFANLSVELPITTRILIAVLDFTHDYGVITLIGAILALILIRLAFKMSKSLKYAFDYSLLFIPVVSRLVVDLNMANFTRILGLLLKSGIPIVEAVEITGKTFSNLAYQKAFGNAREAVRRGEQLSLFLETQHRVFPPLLTGIIGIGESTGKLEENLFYISGYYMEEVDNTLRTLTTLLEPILLIIMGLVVGFVAISIILPIYSLSQGLSN